MKIDTQKNISILRMARCCIRTISSQQSQNLKLFWSTSTGRYMNMILLVYRFPHAPFFFVLMSDFLLFLLRNAGNSTLRLPHAIELVKALNVDVLLVDYRGYGSSSQAAITEEGLRTDAKAVLDYLKENESHSRVVVFGRSLGGALAIAAAADHPHLVSAIIVENTFLR